MLLTGPASAEALALASPDGKLYEPRAILASQGGIILLFTVDWRWASGKYDLVIFDVEGPYPQPPLSPPSSPPAGGKEGGRG